MHLESAGHPQAQTYSAGPEGCTPDAAAMQGVNDALARIVKDEGFIGLFRGAGPTVLRAMALNMGMLASNDQVHPCCSCMRRARHTV